MGKISFRTMKQREQAEILPQLFGILYANMSQLAPTGCSFEEDQKIWLEYIMAALHSENKQILLMFSDENLAGYSQFTINNDTVIIDEVEIKVRYQRTMMFYKFCQYMVNHLPKNVRWFESYVRKDNDNSISVHESLGMKRTGENLSGTSWHYLGEIKKASMRFRR